MIVPTREKTDKGRGTSDLVLRQLAEPRLCPLTLFSLMHDRARRLGAGDCLFCSDEGVPYKQTSGISRLLRRLMSAAGIPGHYVAYSIRHALITALFEGGLSEDEVNAYTGHSFNAHTAAKSYFHLNSKWVGNALAQAARSLKIPPPAAAAIEQDDGIRQGEEMEEHMESEADILGTESGSPLSSSSLSSYSTSSLTSSSLSSSPCSSSSSSSSSSVSSASPLAVSGSLLGGAGDV